ncbi:hypothetical protein H2248_006666 [Termitomyces sp. 'cryptogamus']|nr:hypothetical protein H2248_006666 [Termitomyces sp. 'cryptogamus']
MPYIAIPLLLSSTEHSLAPISTTSCLSTCYVVGLVSPRSVNVPNYDPVNLDNPPKNSTLQSNLFTQPQECCDQSIKIMPKAIGHIYFQSTSKKPRIHVSTSTHHSIVLVLAFFIRLFIRMSYILLYYYYWYHMSNQACNACT